MLSLRWRWIYWPHPKPQIGLRLILVITDCFTTLTQAVPLRKIDACAVVRDFEDEWVLKYEAPETVPKENGSQFASECFRRVHVVMGCGNYFASTYRLRTNRQTEWYNWTTLAILRCYVIDNQRDCDD